MNFENNIIDTFYVKESKNGNIMSNINSILPNKYTSLPESLSGIALVILNKLGEDRSIDGLNAENLCSECMNENKFLSIDNFYMTLDMLYAMNSVYAKDGKIYKKNFCHIKENEIENKIIEINNRIFIIDRDLYNIDKSLQDAALFNSIDCEEVVNMYKELNAVLSKPAKKTIEEVSEFHKKINSNRIRSFESKRNLLMNERIELIKEIDSLKNSLNNLRI